MREQNYSTGDYQSLHSSLESQQPQGKVRRCCGIPFYGGTVRGSLIRAD